MIYEMVGGFQTAIKAGEPGLAQYFYELAPLGIAQKLAKLSRGPILESVSPGFFQILEPLAPRGFQLVHGFFSGPVSGSGRRFRPPQGPANNEAASRLLSWPSFFEGACE
jgi:hypothetical protein